jgi:hypothetical protein
MEEASNIAVCLHMIDGQRLITTFQASNNPAFYESLMISILNKCETFVMIKSYKNEFELDEFDDLVINKNNIVSIKTIA